MKNIETMPDTSKVWVYQSKRILSDNEVNMIAEAGAKFVENWTAHGAKLDACIDVVHHRFIVCCVNEGQATASGCSIDSSIRFMKEVDTALKLDLFDRMQVAYRMGNTIESCSMSELKNLASVGKVNSETIMFNNMVTTKAELEKAWELPLKESWQKRVLA